MADNQDYRKGYKDGFSDGVEWERNNPVRPLPLPVVPNTTPISPLVPKYPSPYPPDYPDKFEFKNKCSVCGITMDGPMLYCCMNINCPYKRQITWSVTGIGNLVNNNITTSYSQPKWGVANSDD
jgi:hypothetical protein